MTAGLQVSGPVEQRSIVTPFGVRFWDPALDKQVQDDLTVTARPLQGREKATLGLRTASGIYVFHHLSGLHATEYPSAAANALGSPPFSRRYLIQVTDNRRRFLAVAFSVELPFQGIYPTDSFNSFGSRLPGFYLFSASTRPSIPTLAVIRAQLADSSGSALAKPAANAVLEIVEPNNRVWYGIADEHGSVCVQFPYPLFTGAAGTRLSPPETDRLQRWKIRIRVRYAPSGLVKLTGTTLPELRSILSQPRGLIWPSPVASVNRLQASLTFGEELILRTESQSALWVQAN